MEPKLVTPLKVRLGLAGEAGWFLGCLGQGSGLVHQLWLAFGLVQGLP